MKRIKYFMAWILMFMMVFMVFPLQQVTWAANSHTSAEAGQWAKDKIGGDSRDWDGVYGVQCVDFIMWYTKGFWGVDYAPQGNASAYSWNSLPSGWTRIQYSSGFVAKPGDIAVWTYCDGGVYGHVGVVTSADSSGMTIAEQWSSTGRAAAQSGKVQSRYFGYNDGANTFYGVVRPLYSDAPAISIDTTINENSYIFRSNSVYLNTSIDENGGNVNAATNSNTQAQKWNVKKSGNAYQIIAQNSLSGRVLNVYTDGTSANGMNVTLWAVTGHQTQLWQFEKKGKGYRIHPSDNLNVSLAVVSGDDVKLAYNSDESNQIWHMETPSPEPAPISPGFDLSPINADIVVSKAGRVTTGEPTIYKFNVLTDGLYSVQCKSDTDVRAWIYDEVGDTEAQKHSDLNIANSFNLLENKFKEEQLYYLHKGTYNLRLTGESEQYFTVTIEKNKTSYGEDVEPNESISSAVSFGPNEEKGGYLNGFRASGILDNFDWYAISIPNAATHTIKLEIPGYHEINLGELKVFDSAGEDVAAASIVYNVVQDKYSISLDVSFSSAGKYYLRIYSVGAPVPYLLTVGAGIRGISIDDTVPSSWAMEKVIAADQLKLITDEMRGAYQSPTTRAEFCSMAMRFLEVFYGKTADEILKERNLIPKVFSDTSEEVIGAAAGLGITNGTNAVKRTFTPNGILTREQAATMLRNVMNVIGVNTTPPPNIQWTDKNSISSWAQSACDVMYGTKIMLGTSKTALVFNPKFAYTHEQAIITIQNLWEHLKGH